MNTRHTKPGENIESLDQFQGDKYELQGNVRDSMSRFLTLLQQQHEATGHRQHPPLWMPVLFFAVE